MSVSLSGGAAPSSVTVVGGSDGTSARALKTDANGVLSGDFNALGTWGYKAGSAGTPTLTSKRVVAIYASAVSGGAGGTLTINGGDSIPVPAGQSINILPHTILTAPTIVFTSTNVYFVETVA